MESCRVFRFVAILVMPFCLIPTQSACAQLTVDFDVEVTRRSDGIFEYRYSVQNQVTSTQSINAILLTTQRNAPILGIRGPNDRWVAAYASNESLFQAGFATGLSDDGDTCGVTDQFNIFPGDTVEVFLSSPWGPAEQSFGVGRTVGVDCDFVGAFITGTVPSPSVRIAACDFDANSQCDVQDIDVLTSALAMNLGNLVFDVNADEMVNDADLDEFLQLVNRPLGDADLNGTVEFADFLSLSGGFGQPSAWSQGDFNADGRTGFADFLILSGNFGVMKSQTASTVPEPEFSYALLTLLFAIRRGRSSTRGSIQ